MPRRGRAPIVFLVVWLTFWASAILVALWHMGATALAGEPVPAVFLAIWLAAAGFGLWSGARRLKRLLLGEKPPRPHRDHRWHDGVEPPEAATGIPSHPPASRPPAPPRDTASSPDATRRDR
jgi:hypothetical protein